MSLRLSAQSQIHLVWGAYKASIAPAAGGRLTSLTFVAEGARHDLIVPMTETDFDEHNWPKAGAFVMAPFANRLYDGEIRYNSSAVQIRTAPGTSHAIHGVSHRRPWRTERSTSSYAVISYTHQPDDQWPWAFSVTQNIQLSEQGLSLRIEVRNTGNVPMPLGLGWHPYHPLAGDPAGIAFNALSRLNLDVRGVALFNDQPSIHSPRTKWFAAPGETIAVQGWDGEALIPVSGSADVAVTAAGCNNAVIHCPDPASYMCVEPVQALPGTLGRGGDDVIVLAPGSSQGLEWRCAGQHRNATPRTGAACA